MGKVFGIDHPVHLLDADLDSYANAPYRAEDPNDLQICLGRSVAINLRHDGRVPDSRAGQFLQSVIDCRSKKPHANLEECTIHYHYERVRKQAEFLLGLNSTNLRTKRLNPWEQLVTVFNLSKVYAAMQEIAEWPVSHDWASGDRDVFNADPRFSPGLAGYRAWLYQRLGPSADYKETLAAILKGLAILGKKQPYRPRWVTRLDSFEKLGYKADPERWWANVGQSPPGSDDWFILLAYDVRDAGPLCRPTQLDAGWFGYHYPGGLGCGHPMEIASPNPTSSLTEEYIHDEIPPSLQQWENAGKIPPFQIGAAVQQVPDDHLRDRDWHERRLRKAYPGLTLP